MFKYNRKPKIQTSTLPSEEFLDGQFASLKTQLDFYDKFKNIFETSADPLIKFQLDKFKTKLADSVRNLTLSGNDVQDLVQRIGSDLMRADVLKARDTIKKDTEHHDGMIFDLVNDDRYGRATELRNQDPLIVKAYSEHLKSKLLDDTSRLALQAHYISKGMSQEKSFNKSMNDVAKLYVKSQFDLDKDIVDSLTKITTIPKKTLDESDSLKQFDEVQNKIASQQEADDILNERGLLEQERLNEDRKLQEQQDKEQKIEDELRAEEQRQQQIIKERFDKAMARKKQQKKKREEAKRKEEEKKVADDEVAGTQQMLRNELLDTITKHKQLITEFNIKGDLLKLARDKKESDKYVNRRNYLKKQILELQNLRGFPGELKLKPEDFARPIKAKPLENPQGMEVEQIAAKKKGKK